MHVRANSLSLEQRRRVQLLCLMYIFKGRHLNVRRVHNLRTRAADVFSFTKERYDCIKYKSSAYYKGSLLWDDLPYVAKRSITLLEFKKHLKTVYNTYNDSMI